MVFFKILYAPNGFLSGDSYYYLNHANSINIHNLFDACNPVTNEVSFFSTWPIGYPLFISLISTISNVEVFYASKILNLVLFLILSIYFYKFLPNNSVLIYCFVSVFLFKYIALTLSELIFIILGYIFVFNLLKENFNIVGLLCGISIFFTRYLGIFVLLFLIVFFILHREKKILYYSFFIFIFISLYVLFIKFNVGFFSGADRVGTSDNRLITVKEILFSFFSLFSFFDFDNFEGLTGKKLYFLGIMFFIPILFYIFNSKIKIKQKSISSTFFIFGVIYLLTYSMIILIPNWLNENDLIPNRFLLPGFLFVSTGLLINLNFSIISRIIIFSGIWFSLSYNGLVKPYLDFKKYAGLNYVVNIYNIKNELSPTLNKGQHLIYLDNCVK